MSEIVKEMYKTHALHFAKVAENMAAGSAAEAITGRDALNLFARIVRENVGVGEVGIVIEDGSVKP